MSLQWISLGEKPRCVRALDGEREVAGGVGAEGVGRVEEDEFAARAHVPEEGIEALFLQLALPVCSKYQDRVRAGGVLRR